MKLIGKYLQSRLRIIIAFLAFFIIYYIVYRLYHVPKEAMQYAAVLICFFALLFAGYDYYKFRQKAERLQLLSRHIAAVRSEMPEAHDLIEKEYQNLIRILAEDKASYISFTDQKYSEMLDYYTLWLHQIKTPIAAMHLLLQDMEESLHKEELQQELFKIEQYTGMVLQYLKLEDMSHDLLLRNYRLEDIVKQAVKKYADQFIYKKISLQLEPFYCTVLTDEKWLLFVIEQLLSNALKYTNQGVIAIYMMPNQQKTLVIEDSGIGISEEDIPRVFEKGYTGYNGRMDKKSTGIGLYLCQQILKKLRHRIRISSTVGVGTKVYIDFSRENIEIE